MSELCMFFGGGNENEGFCNNPEPRPLCEHYDDCNEFGYCRRYGYNPVIKCWEELCVFFDKKGFCKDSKQNCSYFSNDFNEKRCIKYISDASSDHWVRDASSDRWVRAVATMANKTDATLERLQMPIPNHSTTPISQGQQQSSSHSQGQHDAEAEKEQAALKKLKENCDFLLMTTGGFDVDVRPRPIDFVIPGLVRGDVGALIAAGGTGKSFFGLQLCYSLSSDLDITGGFFGSLPRRKVFYIAREDQYSVLKCRKYNLRARLCAEAKRRALSDRNFVFSDFIQSENGMNCDPDNFDSYKIGPKLLEDLNSNFILLGAAGHVNKDESINGLPINISEFRWQWLIKEYVKEYDIDLVILDTLRMCHNLDENSGKEMSSLVESMKKIASSCGCSIIFLHHVNKLAALEGKSSEVAQASRGSSVLVDNIRWQINMGVMSESIANKYKETFTGTKQKPVEPLLDRRDITCISCTKINNGKPFEDVTFIKDNYGALVRYDLTPMSGSKRGGEGREKQQIQPDEDELLDEEGF